MKKRWATLFWTSLTALIGMSWMTARVGMPFWRSLNVALVGMILASAVAFYAMNRAIKAKWPAATVLVCAAPMAIQMVNLLGYVRLLVRLLGVPSVLLFGGTLATAGIALVYLVIPLAETPPPPPVAPARVVDG